MLRGTYVTDYYRTALQRAVEEIRVQADSYILGVDGDQYADYLTDRHSLSPLRIDDENIRMEQTRKRREVRDFDEQFMREFDFARIELPISPTEKAAVTLDLIPSTYTLNPPQYQYKNGVVILEVPATESDINAAIQNFRMWFDNRNKDIEVQNKQLRVQIHAEIEGRKQRVSQSGDHFRELAAKFNIPLKKNAAAETTLVDLSERREINALKKRPEGRRVEELVLERDKVLSVIDIIDRVGRGFERSPAVYSGLEEEQLRDIIVNNLNVIFEGGASGETFQKLGKTDIHLVISAGEILVAECLYWSGPAGYAEKIDQIFRYLTWRESFGIVITFSKNKGFAEVLESARSAASGHPTHRGRPKAIVDGHFQSAHAHPDDESRQVEIHHLLYNLYTAATDLGAS
jgi:hypothetical protein